MERYILLKNKRKRFCGRWNKNLPKKNEEALASNDTTESTVFEHSKFKSLQIIIEYVGKYREDINYY